MNKIRNLVIIFSLKILITIILIVIFYNYNDTKELDLLNQGFLISAVSDSENNGNSSSIIYDENSIICNLKKGFANPYCAYSINISNELQQQL